MSDLCMNTFRNVYNSDLVRYKGHPGGYVRVFLFLLRKAQYSSSISKQFWKILFRLHSQRRGIEISPMTKIGRGFYMGHAYNITINPAAVIGDNCNIHKGVLIGQTNRGWRKGVPKIGNKVWIGINACIVGNVTIGDDMLIAPNSYVNCDVPSRSVVFGNPCVIKYRDNATEMYINNIFDYKNKCK